MTKQPDFGTDLENLNEHVTAAVGDVLQALQHNRAANRPATARKKEEPAPTATNSPADTVTTEPPAAAIAPRRQRPTSRSRLSPTMERDEPLENVTTRLRQRTNELLTEASLRQRLKKESPATRQDIVESALADWFRKHGYLRARDEELTE